MATVRYCHQNVHTQEKKNNRRGKKKRKGKKKRCVWFIGRSTPGLSRYSDIWRPSDHWVSSGFVGPNRSQPYALSAPHYYLSALELHTWQLQQKRRR